MTKRPTVGAHPYTMHNRIQNYAWGTRGDDAYIPRLLGMPAEPDLPYAELWLGAHAKAPSDVTLPGGALLALGDLIEADPEAALGEAVQRQHGQLPFLLKVLSAGQSLSIQAHPTKAQAQALHRDDPEHYPDANHKPELAVALDRLDALVGFRPIDQLARTLNRHPEIADFVGREPVARLIDGRGAPTGIQSSLVRDIFAALIQRATETPDMLARTTGALATRLRAQHGHLTEHEQLFLEQTARYGAADVGLLALFLLNIAHLEAGEGIFTAAGVPHAYLGGNIIECMANSDNVVRVGLTPKFRDAAVLLNIADTHPGLPEILPGTRAPYSSGALLARYAVPTPEFMLEFWRVPEGTTAPLATHAGPGVLLVLDGSVSLEWASAGEVYAKGASAFLPACLGQCTATGTTDAQVVLAMVPGVSP